MWCLPPLECLGAGVRGVDFLIRWEPVCRYVCRCCGVSEWIGRERPLPHMSLLLHYHG